MPSPPTTHHRRLLAEASSPQTPPARLIELAGTPYQAVRQAVATNPGAPIEALQSLLEEFTGEVTSNMAWALAALVNPALLEHTRIPLAQHSADPEVLTELARRGDRDVLHLVVHNPATPPEALRLLLPHADLLLNWGLASNPRTPPDVLSKLVEEVIDDLPLATRLCRNPATPPDVLRRLLDRALGQYKVEVYRDLASNPSTPADLLNAAAAIPSLRSLVAAHRSTPPETLAELARTSDPDVRRRLAENPATPPEVLDTLARNPAHAVRLRVAGNPSCSTASLERLHRDRRPEVREAATAQLRGRALAGPRLEKPGDA